jgi:hypothetical protein
MIRWFTTYFENVCSEDCDIQLTEFKAALANEDVCNTVVLHAPSAAEHVCSFYA